MRVYLIALVWLGLCSTLWAQPSGSILVSNPAPLALTQTVVEVPWSTVLSAYPQVDTAQLRVVDASSGREVAYQLERRGQKTIQNLLVQLSLAPKKQIQLSLRKGKPASVPSKTYGRYVPERFDDFAWENDRIAFRIYGAALDGRSDNAYGTDVWAKRTNELVINKWYKSGDYHKDHGEGLDYYSVGLKLGAGDVGVLLADTIGYIHNYKTWEVLDNGPLRTTFRVGYAPYIFNGVEVSTTKTFSLDAGSQLSRVEVQVTHSNPAPLPMVAGISLRSEPGQLLLNETRGILAYWEPTHGPDGTLGIGCIFPAGNVPMDRKYGHGLARINVRSGEPLVYYTGAAWDKAGLITSGEAWFEYLNGYVTRLKNPPVIRVGK